MLWFWSDESVGSEGLWKGVGGVEKVGVRGRRRRSRKKVTSGRKLMPVLILNVFKRLWLF